MIGVGAILFAVILYVITTELSLFVARRRARAVLRQTRAAGSGGLSIVGVGSTAEN